MKKKMLLGLAGVVALSAGCSRDEQQALGSTDRRGGMTQATGAQAQPGAKTQAEAPAQQATAGEVNVGGMAACRPTAEIVQAADRLVAMADVNRDGRVSKEEASNVTSFLVGGFFFRADGNGDGTITPEEGRQARVEFMNQRPELASVVREVRNNAGQNPLAVVAQMLDVEYGKPLTIAEARQATTTAVNDLYGWTDVDRDGYLTVAEARAAADQGARALGGAAFQAADTDRNGGLSYEEFEAALRGTARTAFGLADTSNNGQLSMDEAAAVIGQLSSRIGVQASGSGK
jgi:Ca2+-binding EF-hand superfamily protein